MKSGIPIELNAICLKAMANKPEQRYATALEMAEDIEAYLSDAGVSACRDSVLTKILRTFRRHQQLSIVALLSLGLDRHLLRH